MGCVCCCLSVDDIEDYMNPNSHVYRNCACLGCFIENILTVYGSVFRRGQVHAIPSSIEDAASRTSTASLDHSLSDMYRSPPRPLPYDADPRIYRSQHDGLVSRREKGSSHLNEESELLRSDVDVDQELDSGGKWNQFTGEDGSKEYHSKSSQRLSSAKLTTGTAYVYASSEEEDVCPTCLEEYTEENPRIMTKCSHHYHLGCIYEWMERSDTCPVCGKVIFTWFSFLNSFSLIQVLNLTKISGHRNWLNRSIQPLTRKLTMLLVSFFLAYRVRSANYWELVWTSQFQCNLNNMSNSTRPNADTLLHGLKFEHFNPKSA